MRWLNFASATEQTRWRSVLAFFVLVFILEIPFWALGALSGIGLLPGLPVAALGAFCPAIAAAILVRRESGWGGVVALLRRSFDFDRIPSGLWYLPALFLIPAITFVTYPLMRLAGIALPDWQLPTLTMIFGLIAAFFVAALGEELGWSAYATDPLQDRLGALFGALLLGAVGFAIHVVPLIQADRSVTWIAWWGVGSIATRVLQVWIYNNTLKSVFASVLAHMSLNVSWQLFPINSSAWDPAFHAPVVIAVVAIVVILWRPATLARFTPLAALAHVLSLRS